MTAVTVTEISRTELPQDLLSGTGKRRAYVFVRYTSAANTDTLDLSSYVPGIADVEGVTYDTMDDAVATTSITWSTYTLTAAGHTGSGKGEVGLIVTLN